MATTIGQLEVEHTEETHDLHEQEKKMVEGRIDLLLAANYILFLKKKKIVIPEEAIFVKGFKSAQYSDPKELRDWVVSLYVNAGWIVKRSMFGSKFIFTKTKE